MEAAHVKKKQKTEEVAIGSWVAVKSLEEGKDSPASRKEPEAHDKAASGKFTFGEATGFLWWTNAQGHRVIPDLISEHRRFNNHLKGRRNHKCWSKQGK